MQERKKTGGRDKGTPNKVTKEVKEILSDIVDKELANIDNVLKSLTPKERLDVVLKLLPFVVPKLRDVDLNLHSTETITADFGTLEESERELQKIFKRYTGSKIAELGNFDLLPSELLEQINSEFKKQKVA